MSAEPAGAAASQHLEVRGAYRFGSAQAIAEAFAVERDHPLLRSHVVDGPQTHDHAARACGLESAAQPEYALSRQQFAETGFTRRQDGPFDAFHVHRADLLSRNDAVASLLRRSLAAVRAGQRDTGKQQRIFTGRDGIGGGTGFAHEESVGRNVDDFLAGGLLPERQFARRLAGPLQDLTRSGLGPQRSDIADLPK